MRRARGDIHSNVGIGAMIIFISSVLLAALVLSTITAIAEKLIQAPQRTGADALDATVTRIIIHEVYVWDDQDNYGVVWEIAGGRSDEIWVFCADEGGFCDFAGEKTVRYGMNGIFAFATFTDGVGCNNGVFGDPNVGVFKACHYLDGGHGLSELLWILKCNDENGAAWSFWGSFINNDEPTKSFPWTVAGLDSTRVFPSNLYESSFDQRDGAEGAPTNQPAPAAETCGPSHLFDHDLSAELWLIIGGGGATHVQLTVNDKSVGARIT